MPRAFPKLNQGSTASQQLGQHDSIVLEVNQPAQAKNDLRTAAEAMIEVA